MNQMRSDLDNLQNNFEDLRKELLSLKEEVSRQGQENLKNKKVTDSRLDALEKLVPTLARRDDIDRLQSSIKEVRDECESTTALLHELEKRLKDWKRILDHLSEKVKVGTSTVTGGGGGDGGGVQ